MVGNHFPPIYGSTLAWLLVPTFVLIGWLAAEGLHLKAAPAAPARFRVATGTAS